MIDPVLRWLIAEAAIGLHYRLARATRLIIDVPRLLTKQGSLKMPGAVNCTRDHDLRIPLRWEDDVGVVAAPAAGTTATSSDAAVVASVDVAADDMSIVLRTAGDGSCQITVTNDLMTDTIDVTVSEPTAERLEIDAGGAAQVVKGEAA